MTPETVTIETPSGLRIVGDHWAGDGDTVVLAHGGGQTRHSWGGTAATLAARGFRVLSIDQRGHGDSDWSPDGDYRLSAFCDDALAVIAWTGAPVAWVGASLGGSTGMHVLAADPTAIDRLVLVDITPRPAMPGVPVQARRLTEGSRTDQAKTPTSQRGSASTPPEGMHRCMSTPTG